MPEVRKIDKPAGDADQVIRAATTAAERLGWVKTGSTIDEHGSVVVSFKVKPAATEQEAAA
jgi:uncharacterized protein GlcG (DUF336 family)